MKGLLFPQTICAQVINLTNDILDDYQCIINLPVIQHGRFNFIYIVIFLFLFKIFVAIWLAHKNSILSNPRSGSVLYDMEPHKKRRQSHCETKIITYNGIKVIIVRHILKPLMRYTVHLSCGLMHRVKAELEHSRHHAITLMLA